MVHDGKNEVKTVEDLVDFYNRVNWDNNLYIGIEWERSGIHRDSLQPVQYSGENGYNAILHKLVEEAGWEVIANDGDDYIELQRGETRVTIEGDGRLELAGSPQESLHDLARELRLHNNEVVEMGNIFGVGWLSLGMQPIHGNKEIERVHKERYAIFENIGDKGLMETMTKRLNGLTVNLSYTDEANAVKKAQTAFRVLPVVGAMFASSPFDNGELAPFLDTRRFAIQNHAPDRTGIPPNILDDDFTLADWISYYCEIPVVLIEENGKEVATEGDWTFGEWMEKGQNGRYPTAEDFDRHVKTTWSDIRLRPSYLEYRVADSVPFPYIMSLPALMKGLLFHSDNWEAVRELTENWTYEEIIELDKRAWKEGLQTKGEDKMLLGYAQELLTLANEKLHAFERTDSTNTDETVFLTELKEQIYIEEQNFAEELVTLWEKEWNGDTGRIVDWCGK